MVQRFSRDGVLPFLVCLLLAGPFAVFAQKSSFEVKVPGAQVWTDTKIDLQVGERIAITAAGQIQLPLEKPVGPDGLPRGWKDLLRIYPVADGGHGALIGRIGSGEAVQPFLIGTRREVSATGAGRLFLGVNEQPDEQADGGFDAKIEVLQPGTKSMQPVKPVAVVETPGPSVTPELLSKIPRRNADKEGHLGDMVNFLIVGSDENVRRAFQSAGWVRVDRTTTDAVLHGLLATLSKQAYLEMPMSELYLFGRPQDYGFAHAEPIEVVASRHHLRLWKAPMELNGQSLWAGAATHDIGFEEDQRNGGITHKIDPNIDQERDYVGQTLYATGIVGQLTHVRPPDALTEAHTATGGSFHSDGRILVMVLRPSGKDLSSAFAGVFCSELAKEHPDAGQWGACSQYVAAAAPPSAELPPVPTKYRLLIVPGILHSCTSSMPAYQKGQEHLRTAHGMTVEYFGGPDDSSEATAQKLDEYFREHGKSDPRKYIVVGYSKGAVDFQEAAAHNPDVAKMVAAFITVSGAVGGSPIAEAMPAQADRWIESLHYGRCQGDLAAAFKSLRQDVRQAFLAAYPEPLVPTYSLTAISDPNDTSKVLLDSWHLLSIYDPEEDGQIVRKDAIVPGAAYLGSVRADHFAVALPLDEKAGSDVRDALNHNHYPRTALLEALLRFVGQDFESPK